MAFWSTEKLIIKQPLERLIEPFDLSRVKHAAYELSLGAEIFVTTDPDGKRQRLKQELKPRGQLVIPPGQFGFLITEEVVSIPDYAIGFISIRFTYKRKGLINVSGFHVDPGYKGHLKFAVYNAGSRDIVILRGDPVFMIWFSDLSESTKDVYPNSANTSRCEITADEVEALEGEVASPAELKKQISDLQNSFEKQVNELRTNIESKLASLDDKITTWRAFTIGMLASLIVGAILLVITLVLQTTTVHSKPVENLQTPGLSQNSNRNDSITDQNSNSATPPSNEQGNKERGK